MTGSRLKMYKKELSVVYNKILHHFQSYAESVRTTVTYFSYHVPCFLDFLTHRYFKLAIVLLIAELALLLIPGMVLNFRVDRDFWRADSTRQ